MRLDVFEFGRRERAWLSEHVVVDADLADVVHPDNGGMYAIPNAR